MFPVDTQNMEIISFINQDYSERKTPGFLKRPNFKRTDYKRPVKERSLSSYAIAYPDEDITFRAGRIKRHRYIQHISDFAFLALHMCIARPLTAKHSHHGLVEQMLRRVRRWKFVFVVIVEDVVVVWAHGGKFLGVRGKR